MNTTTYLRLVRLSAAYDLLVTGAFLSPVTATLYLGVFAALSTALGLARPIPSPDASEMLFINLLGSLVVVWSLWRWRYPSVAVGRLDALARGLFALWQMVAVYRGASVLLLGFTLVEVGFGIAQAWRVRAMTQGAGARPAPQPAP